MIPFIVQLTLWITAVHTSRYARRTPLLYQKTENLCLNRTDDGGFEILNVD